MNKLENDKIMIKRIKTALGIEDKSIDTKNNSQNIKSKNITDSIIVKIDTINISPAEDNQLKDKIPRQLPTIQEVLKKRKQLRGHSLERNLFGLILNKDL
jgi:hypothetical protein